MTQDFETYLQQARTEFCLVTHKYDVTHHGELRTAIDSLLIAYDQMFVALSKHDVSGSDPLYQLAKEIGFENVSEDDLQKVIDKTKGLRSASGAVDKTVSGGTECEHPYYSVYGDLDTCLKCGKVLGG